MSILSKPLRRLGALVLGALFIAPSGAQGQGRIDSRAVTLGLVSEVNPKAIDEHFQPFIRYLARQALAGPNDRGSVLVAKTLPELVTLLGEKKVDFFMESPYPTYVINIVHGAGTLLLRRWKGGKPEYRSLIVALRGGPGRLEDLRGKILAFEDPESTSGYFLPKLFLQRNGFKLTHATSLSATLPDTETGYVFAKSQGTLIDWIVNRRVAAGALSDDDYASLDEKTRNGLYVLARTELLPRHLLSVRKDLTPELTERLSRILRAMHENEEGRKILERTDGTMKFDLLPGGEDAMRRRLLDTFRRP
jgi:phosphonate transport system substrate-binding protein